MPTAIHPQHIYLWLYSTVSMASSGGAKSLLQCMTSNSMQKQ